MMIQYKFHSTHPVYQEKRYTLRHVSEEKIALIKSKVRDFRNIYCPNMLAIDCVALVKKIVKEKTLPIKIKSVNMPGSIDAKTIYVDSVGQYIIAINKRKIRYPFELSPDFRLNFTIAHELGHIYLGHVTLANEMKSKLLIKEEDCEADEFAGQFLLPEKGLLHCKFRNPDLVARMFMVSNAALWQRLNNLKRLDVLDKKIKKRYPSKSCEVCGSIDFDPMFADYCCVCGSFIRGKTNGLMAFTYPGASMDKYEHTEICPVCGMAQYNNKTSNCKKCGFTRINYCVGKDDPDPKKRCSNNMPGYARHCDKCGRETVFLTEGVLVPWWQELS